MPSDKRTLKGFSNFTYNVLSANTEAAYTPGASYVRIHGANNLTASDTREEFEILADDGVFENGSDYKSTELQVKVVQMTLADLAALTGGTTDTVATNITTFEEKQADSAPEVALTFSGLLSNGGHRIFQYYRCKLTSYKADLNTAKQSRDGGAYTLTFKASGRAYDGSVRKTYDAPSGTTLSTYLEGIAAMPASGG